MADAPRQDSPGTLGATHRTDPEPALVDTYEQQPATAGELRKMGYDVPAEFGDNDVPTRYTTATQKSPNDEPTLVADYPSEYNATTGDQTYHEWAADQGKRSRKSSGGGES